MNAADDARFMARALQLAARGLYTTEPNPRVGCVIVNKGEVVGEGWHARTGEAHAEVHALKAAGARAVGAQVYVTLEPCSHTGKTPPCTTALIDAQVTRVVAAMPDPNPQAGGGRQQLQAAGIGVEIGLLQTEAERLNPGFISRMRRKRPLVRLKVAASLDGRTALANGESRWITGAAARDDVQHWRARSGAILTGLGTVEADDPALTVRAWDIGRQPLRVVVDSQLRLSPSAGLLSQPGATLVAGAQEQALRAQALCRAGAEVILLPQADGRVDLAALMAHLALRGVNEVLVEAGPTLCGALLKAGLVDELVIYLAPHLLGDKGRGMFSLPALTSLDERLPLVIGDLRPVGDDWRIIAALGSS